MITTTQRSQSGHSVSFHDGYFDLTIASIEGTKLVVIQAAQCQLLLPEEKILLSSDWSRFDVQLEKGSDRCGDWVGIKFSGVADNRFLCECAIMLYETSPTAAFAMSVSNLSREDVKVSACFPLLIDSKNGADIDASIEINDALILNNGFCMGIDAPAQWRLPVPEEKFCDAF